MALSNLRNEPRREITEQALGLLAIGLYLWADYALTRWLGAEHTQDLILGMFIVGAGLVAGAFLIVMLAFLIHEIGEVVCAGLKKLGLDPRPKRR